MQLHQILKHKVIVLKVRSSDIVIIDIIRNPTFISLFRKIRTKY